MTEFRSGNKAKSHPYPETPRGGGAFAFARNFAFGPNSMTEIDIAGTSVPWSQLDVGVAGVNVPITPRSTRIIVVRGVIVVKSNSVIQEAVNVQVDVNLSPIFFPLFEIPTVEASGLIAIPVLTEINPNTTGATLSVGVMANIRVSLFASNNGVLSLAAQSSSLELQEMPAASG